MKLIFATLPLLFGAVLTTYVQPSCGNAIARDALSGSEHSMLRRDVAAPAAMKGSSRLVKRKHGSEGERGGKGDKGGKGGKGGRPKFTENGTLETRTTRTHHTHTKTHKQEFTETHGDHKHGKTTHTKTHTPMKTRTKTKEPEETEKGEKHGGKHGGHKGKGKGTVF